MTQLLAESHPNHRSGGSLLYREIDWNAVDARAGEILSAEQLDLFQRTEPLGNGPSRFKSRLGRLINQALSADTWGNRPPPPAQRPGAKEIPRS